MNYKLDISGGGCHIKKNGCNFVADKKLMVFEWLNDLPTPMEDSELVEVQFKNTRKAYFRNTEKIEICKGDMVAVESSPGHDIGEVTLTGKLVTLQMKKNHIDPEKHDIKKIYRKAKDTDLEKYREAKAKEDETMIKARKIAESLKLEMKIGDVEFQGDGNKAIFYYIADGRVDFRQLIKVFAETFRVRIEMKQIGARQEAGRIGGIGPCGRELCCSKWMTNFNSVSTSAARYQDLSLNPQKLAGQCAKLKCCMNFELDMYKESLNKMPSKEVELITKDATYYHYKTDIFKEEITYSSDKNMAANLITISAKTAKEIIEMNNKGEKPDKIENLYASTNSTQDYENVVGQDSLTRFDNKKPKKRRKNRSQKSRNNRNNRRDKTAM